MQNMKGIQNETIIYKKAVILSGFIPWNAQLWVVCIVVWCEPYLIADFPDGFKERVAARSLNFVHPASQEEFVNLVSGLRSLKFLPVQKVLFQLTEWLSNAGQDPLDW